jgi:hypothetical protein
VFWTDLAFRHLISLSEGMTYASRRQRLMSMRAAPLSTSFDRIRNAGPRTRLSTASRCELCGLAIDAGHGHVADTDEQSLLCVCHACHLLFLHVGSDGGRWRSVPDRYLAIDGSPIAGTAWGRLRIPVAVACFFRRAWRDRVVALYPRPGGATESELPGNAWDEVVRAAPVLGTLAPEVEAVIVRRDGEHAGAFIVPIDACYELVGRIRRSWRGFQGGDQAWRDIDRFFARVAERVAAKEPM